MSRSICTVADTLLADPAISAQLRFGISRAYAGSYIWAALISVLAKQVVTAWSLYLNAIRKYPRALITPRGIWAVAVLLMGANLYWRVRNRGRGKG
jgi:hypothetical protein